MLHCCSDQEYDRSDGRRFTEVPVIGAVVVIYNRKCTESVSFTRISGQEDVPAILIDNSTDRKTQSFNKDTCSKTGCEYISMDGNKGLAKAYNAAVEQIGSRIDYLMILDDDTAVPEDVFAILRKAIAQNTSAGILVPLVFDQAALLSPCRRWSSLFFRLKKRPESFKGGMSAINSGLVIRIDKENRENSLFDDKMFLDCIDHAFILKKIRQGGSIALYPAEFRQDFFDGTMRDQTAGRNAAKVRFAIFAKDYLYFCRTFKLCMPIAHMYLFYRAIKLSIRFRTSGFGSAARDALVSPDSTNGHSKS